MKLNCVLDNLGGLPTPRIKEFPLFICLAYLLTVEYFIFSCREMVLRLNFAFSSFWKASILVFWSESVFSGAFLGGCSSINKS